MKAIIFVRCGEKVTESSSKETRKQFEQIINFVRKSKERSSTT
ncbi:MAG: hypothetical protein ACHQ1D_06790 [Nitrososphaerales archaeon]